MNPYFYKIWERLGILFIVIGALFTSCTSRESAGKYSLSLSKELTISLVSQSPQIRTPIGLAIDSEDQLYVLESHTHLVSSDYKGPKFDRILKSTQWSGEDSITQWTVFADSIEDGMNLTFGPNGSLFLSQKDKITRFRDHDGDGQSDERETLLQMSEPGSVYDHAGILGITYGPDGWLYISRGNTGGNYWKIEGTDGSFIEGYGDGGNVFRAKADGSQLMEIATGFWNPFDLKFDQNNRLLLIDNDPDSRGPNRLVEIVYGGHYGYESLYGGSGLHPFLAWNGELPATLPYAAPLGEAPSGLIDAEYTNFKDLYPGSLVTIWEENSIVYVPHTSYQSTIKGEPTILLQGDKDFHPVALAANSKGDLFITDWVLRLYPNHGEGKIWKLSNAKSSSFHFEKMNNGIDEPSIPLFRRSELEHLNPKQAISSKDPFIRTTAFHQWLQNANEQEIASLLTETNENSLQYLIAFLTYSEIRLDKEILERFLKNESLDIQKSTLKYIAKQLRGDLLQAVESMIFKADFSPELIDHWLACMRHLQPTFQNAYSNRSSAKAGKIERSLAKGFMWDLLKDQNISPAVKIALTGSIRHPKEHSKEILDLFDHTKDSQLKEQLLNLVHSIPSDEFTNRLLKLIKDPAQSAFLKSQAIISLAYQSPSFGNDILGIMKEQNDTTLGSAIRYLCACEKDEVLIEKIEEVLKSQEIPNHIQEKWELCFHSVMSPKRPVSDEEWEKLGKEEGDILEGKRIFQSPENQCQSCHKLNGIGGIIGPELSHIGSSKSTDQLIRAILRPSEGMSPEWQGWFIQTPEGEYAMGRQIDIGTNYVELMMPSGEFRSFKKPVEFGLIEHSLMPDGLENRLTAKEFRDLITYLSSLK